MAGNGVAKTASNASVTEGNGVDKTATDASNIFTEDEEKVLNVNSHELLVAYNRIKERWYYKQKNCVSFFALLVSEQWYGGIEGLALKVRSAVYNDTRDAEMAKDSVKSASELMTGGGVIGALILSVTVPLLLGNITAHESVYRRFPNHTQGLEVTYKIALMICVSIAITTVAIGARRYHKLNNWMPTLPSQVFYLHMKGQALLASLIVLMFFWFAVTLVFAVGLLQGPWIGFVALCFMLLGVVLYFWDDGDKRECLEHLIDVADERVGDINSDYRFMRRSSKKMKAKDTE